MFKYSNKQNLRDAVSSPVGSRAEPRPRKHFWYTAAKKTYWWQPVWLFSSAVKPKNCHPHHCLANSRTFQDQGHFPGLSGPRKFSNKNPYTFPEFPGGMGTVAEAVVVVVTLKQRV